MNDTYFRQINHILKEEERAIPYLFIDLDLLDQNITRLLSDIPNAAAYRIVVKSLPSMDLVRYVMDRADTNKLMVFNQPFLTEISASIDQQVDILLGKPMPIKTAAYYYNHLPDHVPAFDPYGDIQWLVDTEARISAYIELAKKLGRRLRLNLEIDVGLHRGGFAQLESLSAALRLISDHSEYVALSGLMGYDPHVVKLPSWLRSPAKSLQLANDYYHKCKHLLKNDFPELWSADLTYNGAGSPTIGMHDDSTPLNDLSAGSCLVKPTTFDIPTLEDYRPAAYIATPVLKIFENTTLPGLERFRGLLNMISSSNRLSAFIYGGYWKADYCYPEGVKQNVIFGGSTNQTMINAPAKTALAVDDYVFLRPHQSEFVLLQFGKMLTIRGGAVVGSWKPFSNL